MSLLQHTRTVDGTMWSDPGNNVAPVEKSPAFWRSRARRVQWLFNGAWWIEASIPIIFAASVAMTIMVLAGRGLNWPPVWFAIGGGILALLTLVFSFLRARRHFISANEARARLDDMLALQTRLSAAADGIGAWPRNAAWHAGVWRWNLRRVLAIPGICAALLAGAFFIPVSTATPITQRPMVKPPALTNVEEWLEELAKNPALDPSSLEPVREQAEELAQQKPEEWYSHSSLEAADHLQVKMQAGMRALSENAAKLDRLLGEDLSGLSGAQGTAWNEQLHGALAAMEGSLPALDPQLASQLREIDPSKLRGLSKEQLENLRNQLRQGKTACTECLGEKAGTEEGEGETPGQGAVTRGRGDAPLTLGAKETNLGTTKTEMLESKDLDQPALGDRVGVSAGQHEVVKTETSNASGGQVAAGGAGADAVWIQPSLAPEERRRLRQFFQ